MSGPVPGAEPGGARRHSRGVISDPSAGTLVLSVFVRAFQDA